MNYQTTTTYIHPQAPNVVNSSKNLHVNELGAGFNYYEGYNNSPSDQPDTLRRSYLPVQNT